MNTHQITDQAPALTPWAQHCQRLMRRFLGQANGVALWQKYQPLLSTEYQALVSPRYALQDMLHLENITTAHCQQRVSLLRPCQHIEHYRLHFYSQEERFLDEYMPVLQNMNLRVMDQVQFALNIAGTSVFIKSFTIKAARQQAVDFATLKRGLLDTIQAVLDGKVENDALNKLCVLAGLSWQEIDVLRAYRNYYLQLHRSTRLSVHHALINNAQVALALINYFVARFRPDSAWQDPQVREEQVLVPLRLQLLTSMAQVLDINDDRILRTLFNLIDATMRCNFHLRRDLPDYFVAFKINSLGVIDMPAPKPQNEIYVHSVAMEGIHLRGGKISRGGIRWSDRPDDFRTEILGLMQTQISKNALIIPTGAKGGFIVKNNGTKLDSKAAGKAAYMTLMRGLLDLTDNYGDNQTAHSQALVTYDDPDPYLVVAADKGTAQFSDIANAVAADYQFWLGDAFASGGSYGYDHKALGITARGAWECIKRHFYEQGKNIQTEAFTVVGIGSMDGDVFGNGMLLSPCIRLLAAFSGQHIFIDPNPCDTDAAFNERKRLFELSGSSWDCYDRALISEGGGVYARTAKDIPLSPQLKHWLGLRYQSLDGESLIRCLLTAPVDLLWLGGIGTYVKASSEKHEAVGDRANDNVRVNAIDLRARVVGEGANLGFTQQARIEYSLHGGRINTDAVDNSAGVDTSDHEVNLKILLTGLQKKQIIADYQPLFNAMTADVCRLVLANNRAQSLCLSLDQRHNADNPLAFLQLADHLEAAGFLDREVESFPVSKKILARVGQTLTRPELAVLMAASKRYLTQTLEQQLMLLPDDCYDCYLHAYFPPQIITAYQPHLGTHPLANDIKATMISNKIINQTGCLFLTLASDTDSTSLLDAIGCYLTFDRVVDGAALRQAIAALDTQIAADTQYQLLNQLETVLMSFCQWALAHEQKIRPDTATIAMYSRYWHDYQQSINAKNINENTVLYADIPVALSQTMALINNVIDFPFIVSLALETTQTFGVVLQRINDINQYLGLTDCYERLAKLAIHDDWERKVLTELHIEMQNSTRLILKTMLLNRAQSCADYFALPTEQTKINRYRRVYQDINAALPVNLLPYIVLNKALARLVTSN